MSPLLRPVESVGECRQCRAFCDKLVDPGTCMAQRCPFLYAFDDELSNRRYVGCLHKVFKAEVDIALLRTARPFGGLRISRAPLAHCPTSIEPAFEGEGAGYHCVNPGFWECDEAFDVRDWA